MAAYSDFLRETGHVPEHRIPHYVRWVEMYRTWLRTKGAIAGRAGTAGPETTVGPFLASLARKYEEWQVEQARSALRLYHYYTGCTRGEPTAGARVASPESTAAASGASLRPATGMGWDALDQELTRIFRLKHLSYATEKTYLAWVARFRGFTRSLPLASLTDQDLRRFLSYLAVEKQVAASTEEAGFQRAALPVPAGA